MRGQEVLAEIRKDLEGYVGRRILVRANKGRKRIVERSGILERTYPAIFVVRLEDQRSGGRLVSFSYSDVLTKSVELAFEDESCEPGVGRNAQEVS